MALDVACANKVGIGVAANRAYRIMEKTRGRPHKPEKDRREIRFQVRLSPKELAALESAAGGKTSTWARKVLLKAAKRSA